MTELSIVMPVLNEDRTLGRAIEEVLEAAPADGLFELIIVDDGSTDNSPALIAEAVKADPRIRSIRHSENRGKGSAIVTGLREATGRWSAVMDADLEYEVADIDRLLGPLEKGDTDGSSELVASMPGRPTVSGTWPATGGSRCSRASSSTPGFATS